MPPYQRAPRIKRQKSQEMSESGAKLVAKELTMRAERDKKTEQVKYEVSPFDVRGERVLTWGVKKYIKNDDEWFFDQFVEW